MHAELSARHAPRPPGSARAGGLPRQPESSRPATSKTACTHTAPLDAARVIRLITGGARDVLTYGAVDAFMARHRSCAADYSSDLLGRMFDAATASTLAAAAAAATSVGSGGAQSAPAATQLQGGSAPPAAATTGAGAITARQLEALWVTSAHRRSWLHIAGLALASGSAHREGGASGEHAGLTEKRPSRDKERKGNNASTSTAPPRLDEFRDANGRRRLFLPVAEHPPWSVHAVWTPRDGDLGAGGQQGTHIHTEAAGSATPRESHHAIAAPTPPEAYFDSIRYDSRGRTVTERLRTASERQVAFLQRVRQGTGGGVVESHNPLEDERRGGPAAVVIAVDRLGYVPKFDVHVTAMNSPSNSPGRSSDGRSSPPTNAVRPLRHLHAASARPSRHRVAAVKPPGSSKPSIGSIVPSILDHEVQKVVRILDRL